MLRAVAPHFDGDVINVSGWRDEDKEGGWYRDYFKNARSYSVTNYGEGYRGAVAADQLVVNLEVDLPSALKARADVVFNHTTLEHVFDVFKATANLCAMTRDIAIVVVPAVQEEHATESFGDYWRFTSGGLRRLFEVNGLTPIFFASSPYRDCAIYHLCIASRQPAGWKGRLPEAVHPVNDARDLFRESVFERLVHRLRTSGSRE